jgi:hypothetical protein
MAYWTKYSGNVRRLNFWVQNLACEVLGSWFGPKSRDFEGERIKNFCFTNPPLSGAVTQ